MSYAWDNIERADQKADSEIHPRLRRSLINCVRCSRCGQYWSPGNPRVTDIRWDRNGMWGTGVCVS